MKAYFAIVLTIAVLVTTNVGDVRADDPNFCGLLKAVVGMVSKAPVKVPGPYVLRESVPILGEIDITLKDIEISLSQTCLDACVEDVKDHINTVGANFLHISLDSMSWHWEKAHGLHLHGTGTLKADTSMQVAVSIDDTTFKTTDDAVDVYDMHMYIHADHFNWIYEHLDSLLESKLRPILQAQMTTELRKVLDKCLGDIEKCIPHQDLIADFRVLPF